MTKVTGAFSDCETKPKMSDGHQLNGRMEIVTCLYRALR
jgi:hypothetical protein